MTPAAALGLTEAEYQARLDNPPVQPPAEQSAPMDEPMDDGGLMAEFQARVENAPVRAPTERERSFLPDSPHNRGMALMAEGKYDYAGLEFEKALDLDNDALDSWSALGVCMSKLGQTEAALVCQRQVLRLQALAGEREAQRSCSSWRARSPRCPRPDGRSSLRAVASPSATRGAVCAPVLCRWLGREAAGVCAPAVLELGCGTAQASRGGARGASRVTDGGPPAVLALARATRRRTARAARAARVDVIPRGVRRPPPRGGGGEGGSEVLGGAYDGALGSTSPTSSAHAPLCDARRRARVRRSRAAPPAPSAHEHRVSTEGAVDVRLEHFQKAAAAAGLSVAVLESNSRVSGASPVLS